MAEEEDNENRPLVERWLEDQQEWQKTMLRYMDSMANNEEFLVHLGNAMRGSLLAGKPYPGTEKPAADPEAPEAAEAAVDERLDRILFALHEIQGQLNDLHLTVDRLAALVERSDGDDDLGRGGSGQADRSENDAAGAETSGSQDKATLQSTNDRPARSRSSRSSKPAAPTSQLRRSKPRSAIGRRGESS